MRASNMTGMSEQSFQFGDRVRVRKAYAIGTIETESAD